MYVYLGSILTENVELNLDPEETSARHKTRKRKGATDFFHVTKDKKAVEMFQVKSLKDMTAKGQHLSQDRTPYCTGKVKILLKGLHRQDKLKCDSGRQKHFSHDEVTGTRFTPPTSNNSRTR